MSGNLCVGGTSHNSLFFSYSFEKYLFYFAILVYFFGDLATTYIGLEMGFSEMNPITKNIFVMAFLKTVVVCSVLYFFWASKKQNCEHMKVPIYTAMIFSGLWAVQNNIGVILS